MYGNHRIWRGIRGRKIIVPIFHDRTITADCVFKLIKNVVHDCYQQPIMYGYQHDGALHVKYQTSMYIRLEIFPNRSLDMMVAHTGHHFRDCFTWNLPL
ncbi:hypothetical protein CEXT_24831 [Caerostris extrusa]|uniref:Uncharacterized protein n=1 Tax=Caerostris extrusa TaxID=172846 RepID=A0AAV4UFR0_CAEEX|nr:hypothetical protein CEXT_24831 [Caerostris extrusa]